jgi:hypothetical protein
MTTAVSVTTSSTPPPTESSSSPSANGDTGLLPDAEPISSTTLNDALSSLYALLSELRVNDMKDGQTDVAELRQKQERAIADLRDAIARRAAAEAQSGDGFFSCISHFFDDVVSDLTSGKLDKALDDATKDVEAAWNSPAFWNDLEQGLLVVAKVAGAVGSAAATIATAGAAGGTVVAVALLLSAGGMAVSESGCLDSSLGKQWACGIGLGLELGGAALTWGASLASTSAATSSLKSLGDAGDVACATGGTASVGAGVAHMRVGDFQADAQEASADETAASQQNARLGRIVEEIIESMKEGEQSAERKGESIVSCEQTNDQTLAAATPTSIR